MKPAYDEIRPALFSFVRREPSCSVEIEFKCLGDEEESLNIETQQRANASALPTAKVLDAKLQRVLERNTYNSCAPRECYAILQENRTAERRRTIPRDCPLEANPAGVQD